MTLRQILAENTHVVTTPRRLDKLSTTICRGKQFWPNGISVCSGPDLTGLPVAAKEMAVTAQHKTLWEQCRVRGRPMCIVEDDAWCLRGEHDSLDQTAIAAGNTIVFLGATLPHIADRSNGTAALTSAMGTHAYVITPESAEVLLRVQGIRVVDHITDFAIKTKLVTGILLLPQIFCQLDAPGDIAPRFNFEARHRGHTENGVLPLDDMLGDSQLATAQMRRTIWVPPPMLKDPGPAPDNGDIGMDDAMVLSGIVETLQAHSTDRPLTVLEFGPGRSTELFLRHNCIVRSFAGVPNESQSPKPPPGTEERLRLRSAPLHPEQTSLRDLRARIGLGYDLAFVDAPSFGARDRTLTFECALQSADTVVLHDARHPHEQQLLFQAAQTSGRCIRLIDTRIGIAVLFRKGSFTL